MKRALLILGLVLGLGCQPAQGEDRLRDTVIGAATGALFGQAVGRDTESTVAGAAIGGILGAATSSGRPSYSAGYRSGHDNWRYGYGVDYSDHYRGYRYPRHWPAPPPARSETAPCKRTEPRQVEVHYHLAPAPPGKQPSTAEIDYFNGYFDYSPGGSQYNPNDW